MIPDMELVREIKNGSQSAMDVLVRRYYSDIFAYILRRTTNKQNAYDITQEVFIKMLKNIYTLNEDGKFKSWLFTIAVNQCRDFFRSKEYKTSNKITELEESFFSADDNTTFIFEKKEITIELKKAISQLPDYQSECILLKYFHDFKIKEIVEATNSNESTVKSRLRQGTAKLREILEGSFGNDEGKSRFRE
jgi:RNA polymerase sigma factor (sigma-70 family)